MLSLNNLTGFGGSGATGTPTPLGDFFVWGDNTVGQAGRGDFTTPITIPTQTDMTIELSIESATHNTALHMGYLINKELSTAGDNQYGELGVGNNNNQNSFVEVVLNGDDITSLAFGRSHSLTIRSGEIYGCGRNNASQLTTTAPAVSNTFSVIVDSSEIGEGVPIKVYASDTTSAVLTSNSEIYTWGSHIGTTQESTLDPFNIGDYDSGGNILADLDLVDFAMGEDHALVLSSVNNLYTLAVNNNYGQTGFPAASGGSLGFIRNTENITAIACGPNSSYFIDNGKLFGCGRGSSGELGSSTSSQVNDEFEELDPSITDWIDVQAGEGYVIAKRQDGTLYHTGDNSFAQQGNGTAGADEFGFVQIDGGSHTVTSVTDSATVARFNFTGTDIVVVGDLVTTSGFSEGTYNQTDGIVTVVGSGFFEISTITFAGGGTGSFTISPRSYSQFVVARRTVYGLS